jgi:hypothetical protein
MPHIYSVSIRLRKITMEAAHVSVPISGDFVRADGSLEADKIMAAAVQIARHAPLRWQPDGEPTVELHPIQLAPA